MILNQLDQRGGENSLSNSNAHFAKSGGCTSKNASSSSKSKKSFENYLFSVYHLQKAN